MDVRKSRRENRVEIRVGLSEVLEVGACESGGRRTQTAAEHGRQSVEEARAASRDVRRSRHRELIGGTEKAHLRQCAAVGG
ncbi:unnamed protein product [Strongylus vulgaris]|uniref:Uncharacterized protein n=1 Tax=Strongylus vulgaris TaxID=40348 RepID=A0A3P7IFQ1_STRVU|nr:unnamed protein product [Strongylus vulgaris]